MTYSYYAKLNEPTGLIYYTVIDVPPTRFRVLRGTTQIKTSALTESDAVAGLLLAETALTFNEAGLYRVLFEVEVDDIWELVEELPLRVVVNPTGDLELPVEIGTVVPLHGEVDSDSQVVVDVYNSSGDLLLTEEAEFNDTTLNFEMVFSEAVNSEGMALFLVSVDGVPKPLGLSRIVHLFRNAGSVSVKLLIASTTDVTTVPHNQTTVLVCDKDNQFVAQSITDSNGHVRFNLKPGVYVISLRRNNTTFTRNNIVMEVTSSITGVIGIDTQALSPPFANEYANASVCNVFLNLQKPNGLPLSGNSVIVNVDPTIVPGSSLVAVGGRLNYETDSNGYVSIPLPIGAIVEIHVAGTTVSRRFVVPDEDRAGLFSITPITTDRYSPTTPTLPTAVRRDL